MFACNWDDTIPYIANTGHGNDSHFFGVSKYKYCICLHSNHGPYTYNPDNLTSRPSSTQLINSSISNTFQQICLGKWFDVAQEETTIKIPMALYLYCICLFGHIIFHICITFESRRRRLEKKKINRRCQTPITSLGTLGNIWIRNFSFFFFVGGIAIAER